jgi:putative addiction module antidote
MKHELKVTQIGNSLGVILPKELLAELKVSKGENLVVTSTPEGVRLTTDDRGFGERMEIAEKIMKKRRRALRELAK